jgi:hypothetical protein
MRRLAATVAVSVAVLGAPGAGAKPQAPLLAMVWRGSVVSLTRVDAMSLRPVGGRSLAIGYAVPVARSPRGVTLAFDGARGAALEFVDVRNLRSSGSVRIGDGWIGGAAWPSPRRLVAVVGSEGRTRVVTVDPTLREKLGERSLPYRELLAAVPTAGRVVFVTGPTSSIGPVHVSVAGVDGAVRSVRLTRIAGGTQFPTDPANPISRFARPALAVDSAGGRAAVVDGNGLVAEVDLAALTVAYHPRIARTPARTGKAQEGWERTAVWLPSGTLAVTGMDYEAAVQDGIERMTGSPVGVVLYDTRDWTAGAVDEGASEVVRMGDTLLAFGGAYVSDASSYAEGGIGLRGYGAEGALRFRIFGSERIGDVQTAGGHVYIGGCNRRCFRIVDPASGEVLAAPVTAQTTELVALAP